MSEELCTECGQATGRAGIGEDSLYVGFDGPYCEDCWAELPEELAMQVANLTSELRRVRALLKDFRETYNDLLEVKGIWANRALAAEAELHSIPRENHSLPKVKPLEWSSDMDAAPRDEKILLGIKRGTDLVWYGPCQWSHAGEISEDGFWIWWQAFPEALTEVAEPTHWMRVPEPDSVKFETEEE